MLERFAHGRPLGDEAEAAGGLPQNVQRQVKERPQEVTTEEVEEEKPWRGNRPKPGAFEGLAPYGVSKSHDKKGAKARAPHGLHRESRHQAHEYGDGDDHRSHGSRSRSSASAGSPGLRRLHKARTLH